MNAVIDKVNGDIETSLLRIAPPARKTDGPAGELDYIVSAVKNVPWTALNELKGNSDILKKLDDVGTVLKSLRETLLSNVHGIHG